MSAFGQLASLLVRPEKDAGFEDTFASRFGAAPLDPFEAAALRQRQFTNRQQASGAERAERVGPAVLGGLADLSRSLGEPVTRITDYSRSRIGTEAPVTEEDVFRQDLASRNIGKGVAQAGAYGLPVRNPLGKIPSQAELRGGQLLAETPKAPPVVVQGIRAYHGSPHDVERLVPGTSGNYGPAVYHHLDAVDAERYRRPGGKVYENNLNIQRPFEMDKPINAEDASAILRAIGNNKLADSVAASGRGYRSGNELWYWGMGQGGDPAKKASAVRSAGFDAVIGDPGREIAGKTTRSPELAVFDESLIDILRKYGLAGAGATGFGTLAAQDSYRQ